MTLEQFKEHRKIQCRKWRVKNRAYCREYNRATKHGTHKLWWIMACRKAGVDI